MNIAQYFVSTWGWEQTNVTFYKVLKRTAKTLTIVKVAANITPTGDMEYIATPTDTVEGKAIRRKINNLGNGDFVCVSSYENAYAWNGQPEHGTCWA
jgi:hypothetical protein